MALRDVLAEVDVLALHGDETTEIRGVTHDSRRVGPGMLFVAYRGVNLDVHAFLPDAARRRAAAALVERPLADLAAQGLLPPGMVCAQVANARHARGLAAAALFSHPGRGIPVVGVTGTDGKTTTCTLLEAILRAAGRRPGLVTTVAARFPGSEVATGLHVTTPEPEDLQAFLATMRREGCDAAVLEATSHGLAQHRLSGVGFVVAVVTNVTREALDYHGDFESYLAAKARLFEMVARSTAVDGIAPSAVLNAADPSMETLAAAAHGTRQVVYDPGGTSLTAEGPSIRERFVLRHLDAGPGGLRLEVDAPCGAVVVSSPLLGRFNADNILAAMAAAHVMGCPADAWREGGAAVVGVPGRMERLEEGQPFAAVVDFAHTPNGLRRALVAARGLAGTGGKVTAVVGCAGLRDSGKRGPMGAVAVLGADFVVMTAEDPRTEDLDHILAAMAAGSAAAGGREAPASTRVPARRAASAVACRRAHPGAVGTTCGKGRETSLCSGDAEAPGAAGRAQRVVLRSHGFPGQAGV